MDFRLLGPLQVLDGQRTVPVPVGQVRVVLAVLLLHAGHQVTCRELVDYLWDDRRPVHPKHAVQTLVSRLRRSLGEQRVHTTPRGYLIELGPDDDLDLARFRRLVHRATAVCDPAARADHMACALGLWRGRPFANLPSAPLIRHQVPRLIEERLHAVERWMDAQLRMGRASTIIAELTSLTGDHPLRERFWAQLMVALYLCGRQAEALATYRAAAALLADEIGVDPGHELQTLQRRILSRDPALMSHLAVSA